MTVGILYIGIAKYSVFWKDFYASSEKYFLPGVEKRYFVFTDEEIEKGDNVTVYHQEAFGSWAKNTMYRFKIFLKHQTDYSDCDYLYFFNANCLFLKTIHPKEFIPNEKENYLLALVHSNYRNADRNSWPYDRNPKSKAYIPYDEGHYYFQGCLNGGRTKEFLELIRTCNEWIDKDDEQNIMARFHDESHLNKYVLDKKIKALGSKYGEIEGRWRTKIVLRDKLKFLGEQLYLEVKWWKPAPEKFSLKRYSPKRFLQKVMREIFFKYRYGRHRLK